MQQDATWYGGGPQPKRLCVRWEPSCPSPRRGQSPQFLAHVYCGQTAGWIKMPLGREVRLSPDDIMLVDLGPGHIVLDGGPAPLEKGHSSSPAFWPMSIVAAVAHLSYC